MSAAMGKPKNEYIESCAITAIIDEPTINAAIITA